MSHLNFARSLKLGVVPFQTPFGNRQECLLPDGLPDDWGVKPVLWQAHFSYHKWSWLLGSSSQICFLSYEPSAHNFCTSFCDIAGFVLISWCSLYLKDHSKYILRDQADPGWCFLRCEIFLVVKTCMDVPVPRAQWKHRKSSHLASHSQRNFKEKTKAS